MSAIINTFRDARNCSVLGFECYVVLRWTFAVFRINDNVCNVQNFMWFYLHIQNFEKLYSDQSFMLFCVQCFIISFYFACNVQNFKTNTFMSILTVAKPHVILFALFENLMWFCLQCLKLSVILFAIFKSYCEVLFVLFKTYWECLRGSKRCVNLLGV